MKISVLCPVYNAQEFIEESIKSILNQTFEDFELIICNDASTDKSHAVIKSIKDERIKFIQNKSNIGYLRTINRLFTEANEDLIAFQDADDVSHKLRFEKQVELLSKNSSLSLVGTNFNTIDLNGNIIRTQNMIDDPNRLSKEILNHNPFQKPSIVFRKEILQKIGGFREGFLKLKNISEDYDWLLRASQFFQFGNVNCKEPLYNYRSVPSAMSKNYSDLNQLFGHDVAKYLFNQRIERGLDFLDEGNYEAINEYIEQLKTPYKQDSSLFFVKKAETMMYNGLTNEALRNAVNAFKIRPNFSNFKLLQFCIRKHLFRKI